MIWKVTFGCDIDGLCRWNGNTMTLTACDGSILEGGIGSTFDNGTYQSISGVCLKAELGGLVIYVGGGLYPEEISWSITLPSGTVELGGGGFSEVGFCPPPPSPQPTATLLPTPSPSLKPTPRPSHEPTSPVSFSSCDDLGWTNAADWGSTLVCGESDLGLGGCSGLLSWSEATSFCESAGARLCTAQELASKESFSTGCGLDGEFLWSSTECDTGYSLVLGKGTEAACGSANEANYARCCADI